MAMILRPFRTRSPRIKNEMLGGRAGAQPNDHTVLDKLGGGKGRLPLLVYDRYQPYPDHEDPRANEDRCLVRRSGHSARSFRSSTPGGPRTSPSTTGGRRSGTPSRTSADTRIAPAGVPAVRREGSRSGRVGPCSRPRPVGASPTATSTPTSSNRAWSASASNAEADRVASHRDRAADVAGVLQRLRRPGLPQPQTVAEDDYILRPEQQAAVDQAWPPSGPGRPRCCGTPSLGSARH